MTLDDAARMIACIPALDRQDWLTVGMGMKKEFGQTALGVWDEWSRTAPNYDRQAVNTAWRSFRDRPGGVGIGSVIHLARSNGWNPPQDRRGDRRAATPPEDARRAREAALRAAEAHRETEARRRAAAARKADEIIRACVAEPHPYLAAKGFPDCTALVSPDLPGNPLVVPARDARGKLLSLQTIAHDGAKRFLAGGRMGGAMFRMGRGAGGVAWIVEGYATALSVRAALAARHLRDEVIVAFSAGNIPRIAGVRRPALIVADNDRSGAGLQAARKAGLPYWLPVRPETDANDYHQTEGLEALARAICAFRVEHT